MVGSKFRVFTIAEFWFFLAFVLYFVGGLIEFLDFVSSAVHICSIILLSAGGLFGEICEWYLFAAQLEAATSQCAVWSRQGQHLLLQVVWW